MSLQQETRHTEREAGEYTALQITASKIIEQPSRSKEYIVGAHLYTLSNGESLVFTGRSEALPQVEGKSIQVLTTDERSRRSDAGRELNQPTPPNDAEKKESILVVNATPIGVIDLALHLNGDKAPDPRLLALRSNFVEYNANGGALSPQEVALVDMMAAAVYGDTEKREIPEDRARGLLDVANALNGDQAATEKLHNNLDRIAEWDKNTRVHEVGKHLLDRMLVREPVSQEALDLSEGIVMVHATAHQPEYTADGTIILKPTGEHTQSDSAHETAAAQGKDVFLPRQTTHFSLNHRVGNHAMGTFDGRFTIITPAKEALTANGAPTTLRDVDSYWTVGSEGITLPKAVVVEAAPGQEALIVDTEHGPRVKSDGFTDADVEALVAAYENGTLDGIPHGESRSLADALRTQLEGTQAFSVPDRFVEDAIAKGALPGWRQSILDRAQARSMSFTELAAYAAARTGEDGAVCGLDPLLAPLMSSCVVDREIRALDARVVTGGAHYIDDPELQRHMTDLARALGSDGDLHMGSPAGQAEREALNHLYSYDQRSASGVGERIAWDRVPHGKRRAYVAQGLMTTAVVRANPDSVAMGLFI